MTIQELAAAAEEMNIELTADMQKDLLRYAEMLADWNQRMNLTSITELEEVMEKHFLDCILPLGRTDIHGAVCDVGSGAGFPGLVWAILRRDLKITLLEPTGKRCTFLRAVCQELSLDNVTIVNDRAENYAGIHREIFDAVTARAVAALPVLCELCIPLVRKGGIFLAMKGSLAVEECAAAAHAYEVLGCAQPELIQMSLPTAGERILAVSVKTGTTPAKYPRAFGAIKKKTL